MSKMANVPGAAHVRRSWYARTTGFLFSFELPFAAFLVGGGLEAALIQGGTPIDVTSIGYALSVFAGIMVIGRHRGRIPKSVLGPMFAGLTLFAYLVLSATWSPSQAYASDKAIQIGLLVAWSFLAPFLVLSWNQPRISRLVLSIGVLALLLFISLPFGIWEGELISEGYLGMGRLLGAGVIVALSTMLDRRKGPGFVVILGATILGSLGMLLLGGRGPFLSLVFAAGVMVWLATSRGSSTTSRIRAGLIVGTLVSTVAAVTVLLTGMASTSFRTLDRLALLIPGGPSAGMSANSREGFYSVALHYWGTAPLIGHGLGSWPILLGWGDVRLYPHNIFLEILVETGIVGLLLFVLLATLALHRFARAYRGTPQTQQGLLVATMGLFLFFLFNASVSGDISGNRPLFAAIALLACMRPAEPPGRLSRQEGRGSGTYGGGGVS